jgi:D-glycerate 3-kinase
VLLLTDYSTINQIKTNSLNLSLQQFLNQHQLPKTYLHQANQHFGHIIAECSRLYQQNQSTQIIGINGSQGSGKSTLADYLCTRIADELGVKTLALSMDDFYYTKHERQKLSDTVHPLLATRGVPGTHDIDLAINTINAVCSGLPTPITRFDKSTDERIALSDSEIVKGPVALIVIEGWCFGAKPMTRQELTDPVNALESISDPQGIWRNYVNDVLGKDYQQLFAMAQRLVMLAAPSFDQVFQWRLEQEQKLTKKLNLEQHDLAASSIMTKQEIADFIAYFQRITEHCLEEMPGRVDYLFRLGVDRTIST